jgi:UDP-2,3-diacylglucosamine pyrophosphatase LpxH
LSKDDFTLKSREPLNIYNLSDFHLGSSQCNEKYIDHLFTEIEALKSPVIINILGDLFECADVRVGDSAFEQKWSVNRQLKEGRKLFKRIVKNPNVQIRNAVAGNHEARLRRNDFDLMEEFCETLGIVYAHDDMKIKTISDENIFVAKSKFVDKIYVNDKPLKVFGAHGKLRNKRLDLAMAQFQRDYMKKDADILCLGHNHRCHSWKETIDTSHDEGSVKWKYYNFTGHFLSYPGGYADKGGYDILPEAYLRLQIHDVRDKLFIETKECFVDRYRPDLWKV